MKNFILFGLIVTILTGCSKVQQVTYIDNTKYNYEKSNFVSLVNYMRTNSQPNETNKNEIMKRIELSGFIYQCDNKTECYIYRNSLKVRIYPDHIYIEYPDKSFKKIWDNNLATNIIYS